MTEKWIDAKEKQPNNDEKVIIIFKNQNDFIGKAMGKFSKRKNRDQIVAECYQQDLEYTLLATGWPISYEDVIQWIPYTHELFAEHFPQLCSIENKYDDTYGRLREQLDMHNCKIEVEKKLEKEKKELKKYEKFDGLLKLRGFVRHYILIRTDHLDMMKNRAFEHEMSVKDVLEDILNREFNIE